MFLCFQRTIGSLMAKHITTFSLVVILTVLPSSKGAMYYLRRKQQKSNNTTATTNATNSSRLLVASPQSSAFIPYVVTLTVALDYVDETTATSLEAGQEDDPIVKHFCLAVNAQAGGSQVRKFAAESDVTIETIILGDDAQCAVLNVYRNLGTTGGGLLLGGTVFTLEVNFEQVVYVVKDPGVFFTTPNSTTVEYAATGDLTREEVTSFVAVGFSRGRGGRAAFRALLTQNTAFALVDDLDVIEGLNTPIPTLPPITIASSSPSVSSTLTPSFQLTNFPTPSPTKSVLPTNAAATVAPTMTITPSPSITTAVTSFAPTSTSSPSTIGGITDDPSYSPSSSPTITRSPTASSPPSFVPSSLPTTVSPTALPSTALPTSAPTPVPTTDSPTAIPGDPTAAPTTTAPTREPTSSPTASPATASPTATPTASPNTALPTSAPTTSPAILSLQPSSEPSGLEPPFIWWVPLGIGVFFCTFVLAVVFYPRRACSRAKPTDKDEKKEELSVSKHDNQSMKPPRDPVCPSTPTGNMCAPNSRQSTPRRSNRKASVIHPDQMVPPLLGEIPDEVELDGDNQSLAETTLGEHTAGRKTKKKVKKTRIEDMDATMNRSFKSFDDASLFTNTQRDNNGLQGEETEITPQTRLPQIGLHLEHEDDIYLHEEAKEKVRFIPNIAVPDSKTNSRIEPAVFPEENPADQKEKQTLKDEKQKQTESTMDVGEDNANATQGQVKNRGREVDGDDNSSNENRPQSYLSTSSSDGFVQSATSFSSASPTREESKKRSPLVDTAFEHQSTPTASPTHHSSPPRPDASPFRSRYIKMSEGLPAATFLPSLAGSSTPTPSVTSGSIMTSLSRSHERRIIIEAKPGKLGIILANNRDRNNKFLGNVINEVKSSSPLKSQVNPGDKLVAIDGQDVSNMPVSEIVAIMSRKESMSRQLTIVQKLEGNESLRAPATQIKQPTARKLKYSLNSEASIASASSGSSDGSSDDPWLFQAQSSGHHRSKSNNTVSTGSIFSESQGQLSTRTHESDLRRLEEKMKKIKLLDELRGVSDEHITPQKRLVAGTDQPEGSDHNNTPSTEGVSNSDSEDSLMQ